MSPLTAPPATAPHKTLVATPKMPPQAGNQMRSAIAADKVINLSLTTCHWFAALVHDHRLSPVEPVSGFGPIWASSQLSFAAQHDNVRIEAHRVHLSAATARAPARGRAGPVDRDRRPRRFDRGRRDCGLDRDRVCGRADNGADSLTSPLSQRLPRWQAIAPRI
jgi:hypothetical protein